MQQLSTRLSLQFSLRFIFLAFVFCCLILPARAQEYSPGKGEIRFDGTVISFDEEAKTLVISVASFTLPTGKSSKLAALKPKTIAILPATKMQVKDAPGVQVVPYLTAGVRIVVIGQDVGTAQDFPARLVLVIPSAESTPGAAEGEPVVKAGEMRYEGKVTGVLSATVFTVNVALQTDSQGEISELAETQGKTVEVAANTVFYSRSDASQKLKFEDVKVGLRVTLVGQSGRVIKAREVAIWQVDDSKTRYHGTITVSHDVAILSQKGDAAREARVYEEALKYYNQALEAAQGVNDSNGQGLVYGRLGLTYRELKQSKRAMDSYQNSLAVWRRVGDSSSIGSAGLNISRLYAEADDMPQARASIDEAIRALEADGRSAVLAIAYGHRGEIQSHQKENAEALASWQQALAISRELDDREEQSSWLGQIAMAQARLNQTENANATIEQILALIPQTADKSHQAWSFYMVGVAYGNLGQTEKAIENMKQAEALFTEAGQRENIVDAQKMIESWRNPQAEPDAE